jgi:hypothetical protein
MSEKKAYILCNFAGHSRLYSSWLAMLPIPYEIVSANATKWAVPDDAAIVVSHMHYRWEEVRALRRTFEQHRVPVLILADGILEYRNLYEHPDLAEGCIFQPVVGHKLACIGRAQARVVESWGNVGKCEVVGLPGLDNRMAAAVEPVRCEGPFRLLIATASTPAFNIQQRQSVVESLAHFKNRMEANCRVNGRPLEVTWRLTGGLDNELGLPAKEAGISRPPLSQAIDRADAVITTPSTLFLESVLRGRPTAILDFHNTPHFVPAAWTINAPKHFNAILHELSQPPAAKMLFQETVLHDQLECFTPAGPRMIQLIQSMIECGERTCSTGQPLRFPARIIDDPRQGFAMVESGFDLAKLFPNNRAFADQDIETLTTELNLAIARLQELPGEVAAKDARIAQLNVHARRLLERNRALQGRYEQVHAMLKRLRAHKAARSRNVANRLKPTIGQPESVSCKTVTSIETATGDRQLRDGKLTTPTMSLPEESS